MFFLWMLHASRPCKHHIRTSSWSAPKQRLLSSGQVNYLKHPYLAAGRQHPVISLHSGFYNGILCCCDEVISELR